MVKDLEACESVNWAKATKEHLHKSMAYAKAWLVNAKLEEGAQAQHGFMGCTRALKEGAQAQHGFMGCTRALKAIVYERIPKIRSCTHPFETVSLDPKIYHKEKIVGYPHYLLAVENTPASLECPASIGSPLTVEKTPASVEDLGRFSDLSSPFGVEKTQASVEDLVRFSDLSLSDVVGTWDVTTQELMVHQMLLAVQIMMLLWWRKLL